MVVQRGKKSAASLSVVSLTSTDDRQRHAFASPSPPEHLGKVERDIWHGVFREYDPLTGLAMAVLCSGLEAHQRMRECREIVQREGVITTGKHPKAHPLLAVERDARSAWFAAVKALRLEL